MFSFFIHIDVHAGVVRPYGNIVDFTNILHDIDGELPLVREEVQHVTDGSVR